MERCTGIPGMKSAYLLPIDVVDVPGGSLVSIWRRILGDPARGIMISENL